MAEPWWNRTKLLISNSSHRSLFFFYLSKHNQTLKNNSKQNVDWETWSFPPPPKKMSALFRLHSQLISKRLEKPVKIKYEAETLPSLYSKDACRRDLSTFESYFCQLYFRNEVGRASETRATIFFKGSKKTGSRCVQRKWTTPWRNLMHAPPQKKWK